MVRRSLNSGICGEVEAQGLEGNLHWVHFTPAIAFWSPDEQQWLEKNAKEAVLKSVDWPKGKEAKLVQRGIGALGYEPIDPTAK